MDDAKYVADLFFKKVVYGFNTLHLIPIPSSFLLIFFVSKACRFDQNISKGGEGKKVMIFCDSRTNPSEEGEDDKNHEEVKDRILVKRGDIFIKMSRNG